MRREGVPFVNEHAAEGAVLHEAEEQQERIGALLVIVEVLENAVEGEALVASEELLHAGLEAGLEDVAGLRDHGVHELGELHLGAAELGHLHLAAVAKEGH